MGEMEGWMDETFVKGIFSTILGETVQVKVIRDRNSGYVVNSRRHLVALNTNKRVPQQRWLLLRRVQQLGGSYQGSCSHGHSCPQLLARVQAQLG